jgi:hypothetical protein
VTGRVRGTIAAAVTLGGALILSGCGTNNTAAIVDGTRISVSDAATAAEQFNKQFPPDQSAAPAKTSDVVGYAILIPTILKVGAEHGINVVPDAARSRLTKVADPDDLLIQIVRTNAVAQQLDQAAQTEVQQRFRTLKVTVNPRFGTFDSKTAALVNTSPAWIKAAAATPAS